MFYNSTLKHIIIVTSKFSTMVYKTLFVFHLIQGEEFYLAAVLIIPVNFGVTGLSCLSVGSGQ
jgi:hypothetical protein